MTDHTGPAERGGGRALPAGRGRSGTTAPGPDMGRQPGRIERFTVLYDVGCPICRAARRWLEGRAQLVPLEFVPSGSGEARRRFPGLDHEATLRDVTVIGDDGSYYVGDGAWMACLWALVDYRGLAERMSSPALLPTARRFIAAASAVRERTRHDAADRDAAGDGLVGNAGPAEYYGDGCDDRCR